MPSPYNLPNAGVGDHVAHTQLIVDAVTDLDNRATGAELATQFIPPVGQSFTSQYWISNSTGTLRARETAPMPLFIPFTITVDQMSFNVTVAATTNQVANFYEATWDDAAQDWIEGPSLLGDIDLSTTGVKTLTFGTPLVLAKGMHAFELRQPGSYDTALRVTDGKLNGPWTGPAAFSTVGFPLGANVAVVTGVPIIRLRRSA